MTKTGARKALALASRHLTAAMVAQEHAARVFARCREQKRKAESAFRGALAHAIERKAL